MCQLGIGYKFCLCHCLDKIEGMGNRSQLFVRPPPHKSRDPSSR